MGITSGRRRNWKLFRARSPVRGNAILLSAAHVPISSKPVSRERSRSKVGAWKCVVVYSRDNHELSCLRKCSPWHSSLLPFLRHRGGFQRRAPGSPGASPHKRCSSPSGRIPSSSDSFDGARFIPGSIRCSDRNGVASRCRSHHLTTSRKCRSDIHRVSSGLLLAINLSPNIGPKLFHDNRNRVVLDLRAPYACGIR
jgi:hypothetical protein